MCKSDLMMLIITISHVLYMYFMDWRWIILYIIKFDLQDDFKFKFSVSEEGSYKIASKCREVLIDTRIILLGMSGSLGPASCKVGVVGVWVSYAFSNLINPLTTGVHEKGHTYLNLQLFPAGLFNYVWPF